MFWQILLGIGITVVGALMVIKNEWFLRAFGRVPSAEKYLGIEGGTRLFYKLLGLLAVFIGLVVMTGLWHALLSATLGRLFP